MKKIISTVFFIIFFTAWTVGQVDRSNPPKPQPAPEIKLKQAQTFQLANGLKVFVVESNKLPKISMQLFIDNNPIAETPKEGIGSVTGELIRMGTQNKKKEEIDQQVDFIGATLTTSSNGIYAASLKKHFPTLLEIADDVFFNPSFPKSELEKIKKRTISAIKADEENSASIAGNVSSVLNYGKNHPYGELISEESILKIEAEDCKRYYQEYFTPNNAYLTFVGDISLGEAKKWTEQYFAKWQSKKTKQKTYSTPQQPKQKHFALVDKPSAVQSELRITYPIELKPGSENVLKVSMLNQILGGSSGSRLFKNLRETFGYTYGAYSSINSDKWVARFVAYASVRNNVTDSAIVQFFNEFDRILNEEITEDELARAKSYLMGKFARSLENPQTIARFAVNIARYNLPKDYYQTYLKRLEAITVNDVKKVAKKFIQPEHANIVIVGKANEIREKLDKFGKISYYDIYGNPVEATK